MHQMLTTCVDACVQCAEACERCADACLDEPHVEVMVECIRVDRDCAALCWLTAGFLSRGSRMMADICNLCADMCHVCAEECRRHDAEHCRQCADVCEMCAAECRKAAM